MGLFGFLLGTAITILGFASGQGWLAHIGLSIMAIELGDMLASSNLSFQSNSTNTQNSIPVIYGKAMAGLRIVDIRAKDEDDNKFLYVVGTVCHGSQNGDGIEAFHEMYLDGLDWVPVGSADLLPDGGRVQTSPPIDSFFGKASDYARHKGSISQQVDKDLNATFSTAWPTTSKLAGIAYIVAEFKADPEVFGGVPNVTVVVSGAKVLDTRTSTWAWSDNPALCIYDMLTSPVYGAGIPTTEIDTTSFDTAADICEEQVTHPDATRDRYTCNGIVNTDMPISQRLAQLLSSCNGQLIYEGGTFRLKIREAQAASGYTISEDNIIGPFKWKLPGLKDVGNSVLASFVDPDQGYQVDVVQWPEAGSATENTYLAGDNGIPVPVAMDLPFSNEKYTALDIASIRLKEARDGDRFVCRVQEDAIEAHIGDIVTISHSLLGADSPMDAWVHNMVLAAEPTGEVEMELFQYVSTAYTLPTHVTIAAPPADNVPDPTTTAPVTSLVITGAFSCVTPTAPQLVLTATWVEAAVPIAYHEVQYREDTAPGTWISAPDVAHDAVTTDLTIPAIGDTTYRVRVRVVNFYGAPGAWVEATLDVSTSPTRSAPDGSQIAGGDVTVTQTGGQVRLDVDTSSSNGTIIDWNGSASSGFTPGTANLLDRTYVTAGSTVSLFGTPPGSPGDTVYYVVGVSDCASEGMSEAVSYSSEFSFTYAGVTGVAQKVGQVSHGSQTGTYDIDWRTGTFHTITVGASALTITFSNYAAGMAITLRVTGGAGALTLPAVQYSPGGTTPTAPASTEVDLYGFLANAGATLADIDGHKIGDDYS